MISVIVVDDEWAVGQWLGMQLRETGLVRVEQILQNPHEVMACVAERQAEAVFLDIEMPEMKGIELAEQLSGLDLPPEVIFVTAYDSFALEAFRVNALDYVVKPVHDRELARVLEKVIKRVEEKRRGRAPADNRTRPIPLADLQFPTAKCEELFLYVLFRGSQPISKWRLIEGLWPDKQAEKGESNLRTTVFRLNQTLLRSGSNARVKAVKGFYRLINSGDFTSWSFVPRAEAADEQRLPLPALLKRHNPLPLLEDKDYVWLAGIRQHIEDEFYRWSTRMLERNRNDEHACLQAVKYLIGIYWWQEQLAIAAMPLVLKLEGKGSLIHFYQEYGSRWKEQFDLKCSDEFEQTYRRLIAIG